jgi:hypothetical protein
MQTFEEQNALLTMLQNKKGQSVSGLTALAIAMVILVIIVAVGARILDTVQQAQTANSTADNLTKKGLLGLAEFGNWFTIIVLVGIAGVIIAFVVRAFVQRGQ